MFLFDWFRSFIPLRNPIGFGAADFIELATAVLLVGLVLARVKLEPRIRPLAERTGLCMLLVGLLPLVLRLAMLAQSPVPTPGGADDFAHLLAADTLRHFRLANPPHPMRRFFEGLFILQEPAYASIYPPGPGLVMAAGWILFGHPWAGVVLALCAFSALCYWMLRAWTTPGWALVGGVLAAVEFGPLRYWMNTYWGGAVAAAAGCLIFGAAARLRQQGRTRDAVLLGAGLGLEWLSRPFETVLIAFCVGLYLAPVMRQMARRVAVAALAMLPAFGLTLAQNKAVTGSWTTLPYALSRYQYGIPTTFTVQPNPSPHRELNQEQQLDYEAQSTVHGNRPDSPRAYLKRLAARAPFYRFFFLPPLYLALPAFLLALGERRFLWVAATLAILALGTNFYPYFYPHYIAAAACLFVLVSVVGLERWSRLTIRGRAAGADFARLLLALCAAHFLFWYGVHLFGNAPAMKTMAQYDVWDFVNHGDPQGRIAVNRRLAEAPGRQLVFVRYWPKHGYDTWIQNAADIDGARVVWALDRGPEEDRKLRAYYPDRTVWLLEPDARPPRLQLWPLVQIQTGAAAHFPIHLECYSTLEDPYGRICPSRDACLN